ncbi:MAG: type II toxin-antitoxin system PemK/MazF family toxin [Bacilli bacterium]|nr:type II toxin-antitoxin system PemK/MazF family toxin [Bacilli bacterium]
MVAKYIPKQGDIVYLDFNPTKGHEQKGSRPAIVISKDVFNKHTNMVILCPIISNTKDFPTHYHLEDTKIIKGSVLCEHVRSIDYEKRNVKLIEHASNNDLLSVIMLMNACVEE